MPELPEIETIANDLRDKIVGDTIRDVEILDKRVICGMSVRCFGRDLAGRRITAVFRLGKAVVLGLGGGARYLVVQPMMTGQLIVKPAKKITSATRLIFKLSNRGYLHYNDVRLFGRLQIVRKPEDVPYLRRLGPDPLSKDFSKDGLAQALEARALPIKSWLMNSRAVAGIGNIYASEILFRCGIHPRRQARLLTPKEIKRLHSSVITVLKEAIRWRGVSMRDYRDADGNKGSYMSRIRVYGRAGAPCPRCRGRIERIILSGRSTFFCGVCQI
ncbi:MAG: bifunctional DNA-formamidopyrimidine glycosylase/DNA-(apurinic or apyrimidinic site) lyase [Candidatus Omnitrophota bacterium]|nr:bifunctional DNA-formamidopyrimidine glycosylase/DNA-(apurinic or apyrimidinic site) lyase [Candidatus Omnitrophota bacterium]MDZ4241690.1 bifunctional DNA-formamidopyrimidine glycosylase/DNA-(apurinic or apyrimidinic site) lyase [Candidatus Omnitrophota bacterium]